ncbi:MAG: hypothetical protein RMM51_09070 [Verrucomicrobiae bacterium]|nr:hypothetical protein [Verrucomicrobiae bacterium]
MMTSLLILACATCYGDPNSSHTQGMNAAILFMLAVTGLVLGGLGTVFIGFARRARRLTAQQAAAATAR